MLTYSIDESKTFNFNIYRYNGKLIPYVDDFLKEILQNKADIVIMRIPSNCQNELSILDDFGFEYYLADTLIEYTFKIKSNYSPNRLNYNTIEYDLVNNFEKLNIAKNILKEVFNNYSNHYVSNPYLKTNSSIKIYNKWLEDCFEKNGLIFLAKFKGKYAGFFSGNIKNDIFIGGPGGVLPSFEGEGIYLDAHIYLPYILTTQYNISKCRSGTQVQNHVVQKQWSLLNWSLTYSWLTIHINTFINKAIQNEKKKLEIQNLDISQFEFLKYFNVKYFKNHLILNQQITYFNHDIAPPVYYYITNFIGNENNTDKYHVQINLFDSNDNFFATISNLIK